jgi:Undecaprenyl-phosphate galactose phosphotransferase WbaP
MTTGHPNDALIDFDALEREFDDGAAPAASPRLGLQGAANQHLSKLLREPQWALPDAVPAPRIFRRSLRTAGPFFIGDLIAFLLAGALAAAAVGWVFPQGLLAISWTAPCAVALVLSSYWLAGLYCEVWIHPVVELRHVIAINTVVLLASAVGALNSPPMVAWCALVWVQAFVLVPLLRVLLRHVLGRFDWWGFPTLIIGLGKGADELAASLLKTPHCSLRPAIITDPESRCRVGLLPVINDPKTLESVLRTRGIRHAVFAIPESSTIDQRRLLDHYGRLLPHLLVLSDTRTLPALWGASRNNGRLSGFEVHNGRLIVGMQLVKRALDLTVALAALPVLVLIAGILAILSRILHPGPLFFGHARIGQHGRKFKVWKFRTMHVEADRMLREHLAADPSAREEWEKQHKLRNDPRITPLGRFLRSTSLDELPQLWNVLRGDMSLVGPRPIVQAEVPRYGADIELYAAVKPGISGLWQVSGRTDISYDERVELDLFYIRHWSPWLDLYILAKTVFTLLQRSGAY